MTWMTLPLALFLGLIFGSFLSMLIPRLHAEQKGILWGRSECPNCKNRLRAHELIPLFSYLIQAGRCRHCKKPISFWYPATELLLTTLSLGASFLSSSLDQYLLLFPLIFVLTFVFIYDLRYKEIHEVVLVPGILYAIVWGILTYGWQNTFLAMVIGFSFFGLQYLISKGRWIGSGDIEIGLFMGALLGWPTILPGIFISYLIGSLVGIVLLVSKKANAQSAIPLGPFLMIGTVLSFVWGEQFLSLYLNGL